MTTLESQRSTPSESPKHESHRLRNFMLGVGVLVGSLVVFDAHEVKDPTEGMSIIGFGTGVVEDLTGKDNIYLDWVDLGAMITGGVGAAIAIEAVTRREDA